MSPNRHILFVGGGTSGHIGKLLAVMQAVQEEAAAKNIPVICSYVGLKGDLESPLITTSSLSFAKYSISSGKLNRFLTWRHFPEAYKLGKGIVEATQLIKKLRPDCIFMNGGYVTIPLALAAGKKIPIITHETDVIPGLANRFIAKKAHLICTTYPIKYYKELPQEKLRMVGQPVREVFYKKQPALLSFRDRPVEKNLPLITVIGGSQGAHRLNLLMAASWAELLEQTQIIHITGIREFAHFQEQTAHLPKKAQSRLWLVPFINEELPAIFGRSDLVISRAGGTIAELAAMKKATILLPLSTAAQNHQWANAQVLVEAGAAIALDETSLTSRSLTEEISRLIQDGTVRKQLESAIAKFDRPEAASSIAKLLLFP